MKFSVCFVLVCTLVFVRADKGSLHNAALETSSVDDILQYGLDLVLQKLEHIDRKLLDLQFELKEHREQTEITKVSHEKTFAAILTAINRLEDFVLKDTVRNISVLQDHSTFRENWCNSTLKNSQGQGLEQHKEGTRISLSSLYKSRILDFVTPIVESSQQESTTTTIAPFTTTLYPEISLYSSCNAIPSNFSGVYRILVNNDNSPFKVYCEMEKFGGGWIVVQHRFDGSVDFYRNWTQYREGFGELDNEFWIGLEKMHQITKVGAHEIIFEIKDFRGNYGYARYDHFQVGSESEEYSLNIGKYSGTAGDAMGFHKGMKFSTIDRDNDGANGHCAQKWASAWWYNDCSDADLNGPYKNDADGKSMVWYNFKSDIRGMSYSRMMIREL